MSDVLVCIHRWREWAFYIDANREDKQGKWRACTRCDAVQRNDQPEPRTVLMRIEKE